MSWQEELRKLDEELASGRLSADDYRVRRDQVLSSAVAHGESGAPQAAQHYPQQQYSAQPQQAPQAPQAQQPQQYQAQQGQAGRNTADSTQIIAPVSPPHGTPQQNPPQPSAEATQVVPAQDLSAERTQAVPAWQTQPPAYQSPQQHPASPAGGFAQPQSPPGGFGQQHPQNHQQPWNAPAQDLSPPWGGSDFPPIAPSSGADWAKQGPEVFEERPPKGKGGRIAVLAIVGVLVLAGLGVGGYFLFSGSGDGPSGPEQTQAQNPPPAPPPSSTTPASPNQQLLDKLPKPPGQADKNTGLLDLSTVTGSGIMAEAEGELLSTRSVEEVAWRGSKKAPDESGPKAEKFSLMVVPLPNGSTAGELAAQLRQFQEENGYTLIPELGDLPQDVVFHKNFVPGQAASYRGTYVSGSNLVRIDVAQEPGDDEASLSGQYQRAVKLMLEKFPVG
ncbi:flagellar basal body-associated protein FliL [Amycolatopsis antarctica]|uniref:flagellar basal body-associated protein FliL n=1 Tax=Amycolatopsis antarctica TaxID=1854586 RepID=UPI0030B82AC4